MANLYTNAAGETAALDSNMINTIWSGVHAFGTSEVIKKDTLELQTSNLTLRTRHLKNQIDALGSVPLSFFTTNQTLEDSGYQKFPGGLIIQWKRCYNTNATPPNSDTSVNIAISPPLWYNDELSHPINFPVQFPTRCFGVSVTVSHLEPSSEAWRSNSTFQISNISTSGCYINLEWDNAGSMNGLYNSIHPFIIAIGH